MSKRFIDQQQSGDRKKPRRDYSVADHNFPLSQNAASNNVPDFDENDDELLLQATQACEQVYNASVLPEYSQFMPPAVTSTQLPSEPSSSIGKFSYKIPGVGQKNTVSTGSKDKCDRISSPLRGINAKVIDKIDLTNNYLNDVVFNSTDTGNVYKQLLHLKEENAKLKSENGKLLEECVTQKGEATILRTQLKSCQEAVDKARLEKLRIHEQAQIHWTDKLKEVNEQLSDIRTQLDTKNLEVISIKEKCKMLESNKVKLTQITVAGNDMSRLNNSVVSNSFLATQSRRVKTASATVQTDNNPRFLKLSKPCRKVKSKLTQILPIVMETPKEQQYSILDYNEKLKKPTDFSPNKSRTLSSFYRPSSSTDYVSKSRMKVDMSTIYEDLMCIAACSNEVEEVQQHYVRLFEATRLVLEGVQSDLELVSRRLTSAFQKEMDKRYMETTMEYHVVGERDLVSAKALLKEEQSILARRMTAVLYTVLEDEKAVVLFVNMPPCGTPDVITGYREFIDLLCRICTLLDHNCCGLFYSGLLYSLLLVVEALAARSYLDDVTVFDVIMRVIPTRGLLFVPCKLLHMLCAMECDVTKLCSGSDDLRLDYEQGVLLFKKESCLVQVLLRQVESSIKCMEQQRLLRQAVDVTRDLVQLHSAVGARLNHGQKAQCKCGNLLIQVVVQSLKTCSTMLDDSESDSDKSLQREAKSPLQREALAVCRAGLQALYRCSLDGDLAGQLGYDEGNLLHFCERLACYQHNEFYSTMLSEMMTTFQAVVEDTSTSFNRDAWLRSFQNFTVSDRD